MKPSVRPILGLDDVFGARAKAMRLLQVKLGKLFEDAGFEEVIPPILERPETLNRGAGRFLADQTLVFSDPADAGLLAIRPDITPQVARIAATRLQQEDVLKLYYSGEVLQARPDSRTGSRQQWQMGVEYLGEEGSNADIEVMHLASSCLHQAGFHAPVLQVGHMGLLKSLVAESVLPLDAWAGLLARRSPDDVCSHLQEDRLNDKCRQALLAMASGTADASWLKGVRDSISPAFRHAADELLELAERLSRQLQSRVGVLIDAALMPRFLYHSGVVFSGFAAGVGQPLLHGGRYDDMMASHGRDMPATGFSFDLWLWLDSLDMRGEDNA